MLKNTLLATSLAFFATTAAYAEGDAPGPQMSVEQVETYSAQNTADPSAGVILPLFLLILAAIAVGGSNN